MFIVSDQALDTAYLGVGVVEVDGSGIIFPFDFENTYDFRVPIFVDGARKQRFRAKPTSREPRQKTRRPERCKRNPGA